MRTRYAGSTIVIAMALAVGTVVSIGMAQDASVVPRTLDGHPDLQGNWTNGTITPIERPEGQDRVLTPEQVAAIEGGRQDCIDANSQVSDPDREAPTAGGEDVGCDAVLDAAAGGTGGYNLFWLDRGDRVAMYNGEPRSSLITSPGNGRIPPFTPEGQRRRGELFQRTQQFDEFDNPETRPIAERCILSFGSNAGPPMLPNYFYNNNYTIVQTADYVMIMTEMVHDTRIVKLGEPKPLPDHMRPWMGDSWGWWEDDTLVVETTNLNPEQLNGYRWFFGASDGLKVTERFTRVDANTINYQFMLEDPATWTSSWGGEVPFTKMDGRLYEYACHEANYAMENVLRGARAQERNASNDR